MTITIGTDKEGAQGYNFEREKNIQGIERKTIWGLRTFCFTCTCPFDCFLDLSDFSFYMDKFYKLGFYDTGIQIRISEKLYIFIL